jgi:LemA protein
MIMSHRIGSRPVRLAALLTAITLLAGCSYNKFTAKEEEVKAQWAQVENQLQRRNDLIPNLVETVKGFAKQESSVFASIADARARMAGAQSPAEKISAANAETSALGRLFVVMENYPQLKSDAEFARLMDALEGTENRLSTERMRYNDRVRPPRRLAMRDDLKALLAIDPHYPQANGLLGAYHFASGEYEPAIQLLSREVEPGQFDPSNAIDVEFSFGYAPCRSAAWRPPGADPPLGDVDPSA